MVAISLSKDKSRTEEKMKRYQTIYLEVHFLSFGKMLMPTSFHKTFGDCVKEKWYCQLQ